MIALPKNCSIWELLHNPEFNCLEFKAIKKESGDNGFVITPKRWIEVTGAVGSVSKQGRYAATYAHRDIAFEFASWISPEFKLYIVEDYQRLKNDENSRLSIGQFAFVEVQLWYKPGETEE